MLNIVLQETTGNQAKGSLKNRYVFLVFLFKVFLLITNNVVLLNAI